MRMPPPCITDQIMADLLAHAEAEYPRESCGLVVLVADGARYLPRANTADDPERDFRISPQGYAGAAKQGQVLAVIHSHPRGPQRPSESDMAGQIASRLPWAIVPMVATEGGRARAQHPLWWGPTVPVAPLLEREFVVGLADCYALARDWYRTQGGAELPDFARPDNDEWWQQGRSIIADQLALAGFARCDDPAPDGIGLPGDGFVMQIGSSVPNHVAVYVGGGLLLHHLRGRLSRREPVHRWRSHIVSRVRLSGGAR